MIAATATRIALSQLRKQLTQGFEYMMHHNLYVGIPRENASHAGPMTNIDLLYLHENGVPSKNIPARPAMKIGMSSDEFQEQARQGLHSFCLNCVRGNVGGAQGDLETCGIAASNVIKDVFGSGQLAPNAPYTIAKKGSSAPLIDTAQLRNSITYVIREE